MKNESENTRKSGLGAVMAGVLSGVSATLILLFVAAAVLCLTPVSGGFSETAVLIATVIGIFASGFLSGAKRTSSGWLWGGISGVIYAAVVFAASALHGTASVRKLLISAAVGFVCASAGGILGINLTKR